MLKGNKKKDGKYYKATSLAEMMIVMVIFSIIFFLIASVINVILKTSYIVTGRVLSREESVYILEMFKRNLRNANPEDIYVYNVSGVSVDLDNMQMVGSVNQNYSNLIVSNGESGNQVHVKPFYSSRWICFGIFPLSTDHKKSVLLKTSTDLDLDSVGHDKCFNSSRDDFLENTVILNSSLVNVSSLSIIPFQEPNNVYFAITTHVEPLYWASGISSTLRPDFIKTIVVSTRKLTYGD